MAKTTEIVVIALQRAYETVNLTTLLRRGGYAVFCEDDALRGLLGVLREKPRLVVVEAAWPTGECLTLAKILRLAEVEAPTLFYVISATPGGVKALMNAGATKVVKMESWKGEQAEFMESVKALLAKGK